MSSMLRPSAESVGFVMEFQPVTPETFCVSVPAFTWMGPVAVQVKSTSKSAAIPPLLTCSTSLVKVMSGRPSTAAMDPAGSVAPASRLTVHALHRLAVAPCRVVPVREHTLSKGMPVAASGSLLA